ncbi:MAG TPA: hypothetical protein VFU28_25640 [Vicinamibacterales bacterium]|nr:hypothetical protein [Vicinamibacterales bacterium]
MVDWPGLFTVAAFVVYIAVFRWALTQKSKLHKWHHCVVLILATLFWWLGEALAIRFGKYQYDARFMMFPFSGDPQHPDLLQHYLGSYIGLLARALPGKPPTLSSVVTGCQSLGQTRWEVAVPVVLLESALVFTMLNLAYQRFVEPKNATWQQKYIYLPAITGAFCALLMVNLTFVLDPVVSTKEWCGAGKDPAALDSLRGLNIGLWHWFTNENNPGYWFDVPLGNYVAWFAATLVFTAFYRVDRPGPQRLIKWFEANYWFRYVPGMILLLFLATIAGTTLYFYLGAFVGRGNQFLESFHIRVDQRTWQFFAMGVVLALAGIFVALRGRHYRHRKFTALFWLPQFTIFGFCFAAILFNSELLVIVLLGATVGVAMVVQRWERQFADAATVPPPTAPPPGGAATGRAPTGPAGGPATDLGA